MRIFGERNGQQNEKVGLKPTDDKWLSWGMTKDETEFRNSKLEFISYIVRNANHFKIIYSSFTLLLNL